MKLSTFVALLPLVLVQAAGFRRPVRAERLVGLAFGSGVGALYAVTTVSGPPLALMLNNQGLAKQEFRAALGLIRLAESTFTAIAYFYAGLYALESLALIAGVARVLPQLVEPPRHQTSRTLSFTRVTLPNFRIAAARASASGTPRAICSSVSASM